MGSGCCSGGPKAEAGVTPTETTNKMGSKGCCSPPAAAAGDEGEHGSGEKAAGGGCCSSQEVATSDEKATSGGCCSSKKETNVSDEKATTGGCCATKKEAPFVTVTEPTVPKDSGCCPPTDNNDAKDCNNCDTACLDRVALRECLESSPGPVDSPGRTDRHTSNHPKDKACGYHRKTAAAKYADTLQALGCLCRALLSLGQDSCCDPPRARSSLDRRRAGTAKSFGSSSSSLVSMRSAKVKDECCASGSTTCVDSGAGTCKSRARNRGSACAKEKQGVTTAGEGGGCCSEKPGRKSCSSSINSHNDSHGHADDDCCGTKEACDSIHEVALPTTTAQTDLEKGAVKDAEHMILSVAGMTCTGCENKLRRALAPVPAVHNLKTSLLLSRAEFDLDTDAMSIDELFQHLEHTTAFKYEKIAANAGTTIDLVASPADLIARDWPAGVTGITALTSSTVAVDFDPSVIGARDLVEKGWDTPLALAPPRGDPSLQAGSKHVWHLGLMTLLSAVLTIPVLVMSWAPLPSKATHELAYAIASLVLATVVQVAIAGPMYPQALKALIFSRIVEMELLVVLSTSAAYVFSLVAFGHLVAGQPLSTGEFFETSTLLVTLIMVGRWVTALARQKAVESISIRSLQAQMACLVGEGVEREVDTRLLQYGDCFKVVPDSRVPTDGTVVSGKSEVDESMITGESRPVEKGPKSGVVAGSINGSGTLIVRLTRLPGDNTISTIAGMVDEAKLTKPKIQDVADTVAGYFVPVILVITVIVFSIWLAVGITIQGQSASEATIQAVTYAITVLIVSCPCAIGLAVPMVIVIASGVAAERGVIFKSAESIEVAHRTSHVVFDKTGTLTEGKLAVVRDEYLAVPGIEGTDTTKSLICGLLDGVKHPVSLAVSTHLKDQSIIPAAITEVQALTGKGVEGISATGQSIRAGNSRWLNLSTHPLVAPILSSGHTAFCVTIDSTLAAIFALADTVRPDAAATIAALQKQNISVHMLSGDDDGAVRTAASALGIPPTNVRSRCTPGEKQAYIQSLLHPAPTTSSSSAKSPVVIFCGDGTNDSVALAGATIGVHISGGTGTDVAQAAADVVLVRPDISKILTLISVSRKAKHRIVFNFGWSAVYNLFAVLLAAGAFVRVRIPPELAGLGELASVLPVILAGVGLKWARV